MKVAERCKGCVKTGGWHMNNAKATDKPPVFHHVYVAFREAKPAVAAAKIRLAELKALKAA